MVYLEAGDECVGLLMEWRLVDCVLDVFLCCSREQRSLSIMGKAADTAGMETLELGFFLLSQPPTRSTSPSATPGVSVDIVPSFC